MGCTYTAVISTWDGQDISQRRYVYFDRNEGKFLPLNCTTIMSPFPLTSPMRWMSRRDWEYTYTFFNLATRGGIYEAPYVLIARYMAILRQDIQEDLAITHIWIVEKRHQFALSEDKLQRKTSVQRPPLVNWSIFSFTYPHGTHVPSPPRVQYEKATMTTCFKCDGIAHAFPTRRVNRVISNNDDEEDVKEIELKITMTRRRMLNKFFWSNKHYQKSTGQIGGTKRLLGSEPFFQSSPFIVY